MTSSEIIDKIWEICNANAQLRTSSKTCNVQKNDRSETIISQILLNAKTAAKHSLRTYESFRTQIADKATSPIQYETAVKQLAAILCV